MDIRKGGSAAIIATSSPLLPRNFVLTPELLCETVMKLGFRPVPAEALYASTECGFSIAPAELRARDIMNAFKDPDIDVIWCAIGGSTAMQLLPLLDYDVIRQNPKPFIGLSDVTALLIALNQRAGIVTYHGPTLRSFVEDLNAGMFESLAQAVAPAPYTFRNPPEEEIRVLRPGSCEGTVIGGNLSLVAAMQGTPYGIMPDNKIIYLEDVGEPVYRIERMLTSLRLAGVFDRAAGVLLGQFVSCFNRYKESYGPNELLRDYFADYEKPVLCNIKSCHSMPIYTIPFGRPAVISGGELRFL